MFYLQHFLVYLKTKRVNCHHLSLINSGDKERRRSVVSFKEEATVIGMSEGGDEGEDGGAEGEIATGKF